MKIRFCGVRACLPTPLTGQDIRKKIQTVLSYASPRDLADEESIERFMKALPYSLVETYGSNTSCIEVRSLEDDLIIIDAGSALRSLGNELLKEGYGEGKGECNIIFTHSYWECLHGLPFFAPLYVKGNSFHFHAVHKNIEECLRYQYHPHFFPLTFEQMPAKKYFHQHDPGETWEVKNVQISQRVISPPKHSCSYRFEEKGKVFIFCSDAELSMLAKESKDLENYIEYFWGADLLLVNVHYAFEDKLQETEWGQRSSLMAVHLALHSNVKQLLLSHYDPSYSDEKLSQLLLKILEYKRRSQKKKERELSVSLAYEGLEIEL